MKKEDIRIAVMLRGHVRTWHYIYPLVFDFYDNLGGTVDYYFCTWDTSNTKGVKETFKGKNLISFQILPHDFEPPARHLKDTDMLGKYYTSMLGPPYMNKMMEPYLDAKEKEMGKFYDVVFDTRPDILPAIKNELTPIFPELNAVVVTGLEVHTNLTIPSHPKSGKKDIAVQDWLMMMKSKEFRKMTTRYDSDNWLYKASEGPGCQIEYREYVTAQELKLCTNDWIQAQMIRPNCFALDWIYRNKADAIQVSAMEWAPLEKEEKIRLCERYGVALSDYTDTHSATCKI
jgi:hypothetical protein|tara:strand:- start:228 stop:1091 length:864 start_codon:yes stop_codon:yes gene_type:complete